MACACYVIILQRILYWFVREKADDSPVSDLLPANLHLLYHLWKPLNMDFTYKQMFFCILFHLLWLFLPTFCRPGYLFVWSWQAGEDPCPLLLLLPARSPYAVLGHKVHLGVYVYIVITCSLHLCELDCCCHFVYNFFCYYFLLS